MLLYVNQEFSPYLKESQENHHQSMAGDDEEQCVDYDGNTLDLEHEDLIRLISTVSAIFSLVGCSFIMLTYFLFPTSRSPAYRIIFFLSLCNWMGALQYVIAAISTGANHDNLCGGFWCTLTACFGQFFEIAGFVWVWCIGFNVYMVLRRALQGSSSRLVSVPGFDSPERHYHAAAWGASTVYLIIGLVTSPIGAAGAWCWFQRDITQIFIYYVPAILCFCSIVFFYIRTAQMIRDSPLENRVTGRLRLYLLCYIVVVGCALLNRVVDWSRGEPVTVLLALHAAMLPLQGFLYSVVYGMNKQTQKLYIDWWQERYSTRSAGFGDKRAESFQVSVNSTSV